MTGGRRPPGPAGECAADVGARLGLVPHSEGGFFRETYRSPLLVATPRGPRSLSTSILYLVDEAHPSCFHRLVADEMWFFHEGAPLEMVFLEEPGRRARSVLLNPEQPQALAPARVWMAARVAPGTGWALAGCVVTPGFEYEDFERAAAEELLAKYPLEQDLIRALT